MERVNVKRSTGALPVPATPFVGRTRELADLAELATRHGARIVTLVGPGGTGKTRLALQAAAEIADEYPDGMLWVPLADVRDPGEAASALWGAVEETERRAGFWMLDNERVRYEQRLDRLGGSDAWEAGRALSRADAAQRALAAID